MSASDLPLLNAILNSISATFLVIGWVMIRSGRRTAHRNCMLAAFTTSVLFLVSYLIYHYQVGSVPYEGVGAARYIYFTLLISHIILAAIVPFLALITLWRGLRERFESHKRIARYTLPIWLYVSATGVAVYVMLYQL